MSERSLHVVMVDVMGHGSLCQAFQLQAAFLQWQRAAVDSLKLKEFQLAATLPPPPREAVVELSKVKAYLQSVARFDFSTSP